MRAVPVEWFVHTHDGVRLAEEVSVQRQTPVVHNAVVGPTFGALYEVAARYHGVARNAREEHGLEVAAWCHGVRCGHIAPT